MKMPKALFAALLAALIGLGACSTPPPESLAGPVSVVPHQASDNTAAVRVIVTRNFGSALMLDEALEATLGLSAMAALERVAEVETAYGGGFVDAIDGLGSGFTGGGGKKEDWFFYINGLQSNVGALDYELQPGDLEHWDFHNWGFRQSVPAAIGAFPEPFLHGGRAGKRPTLIVADDNLEEEASRLKTYLEDLGVKDISVTGAHKIADSEKEVSNLILLGAADNALIAGLNTNYDRLGFFAFFKQGELTVFNAGGETTAVYGAATGLIQATQNPWNPNGTGAGENVAWLITGTDNAGVKMALQALLEGDSRLQYAFATVATGGEVIRIPR